MLIDSIPYVSQWLANHPQASNREAILLPSTKTGKAIRVNAMFKVYKDYKSYFPSLLSENIPEDDEGFAKKALESVCLPSFCYYREI